MVNSLNINSEKYFIFLVNLTNFADDIEQLYTNKYIVKYGYNNVRGGKYTNSTTLNRSKTYGDTREYMESDVKIIHFDENYVPDDQVESNNEDNLLYGEIF